LSPATDDVVFAAPGPSASLLLFKKKKILPRLLQTESTSESAAAEIYGHRALYAPIYSMHIPRNCAILRFYRNELKTK
jgi:hypothetical protein